MTAPDHVDELDALRAVAERRRATRRRVADAVVDHGTTSRQALELREVLRVINTEWVELIRRAAAGAHTKADIARAAGIAAPSLYYRLNPAGGRSPEAGLDRL